MLEQLLIILLLFVFLFMSMLVEWIKRRQRRVPREAMTMVPPVPVRTPMPVPSRAVAPQRPRAEPRGAPGPMAEAPSVHTLRALAYIHNPREVRRGIVLMTILEPCRALEPPHPRQ
jgi:hypothetical protein